jgi:protoporphyrinogen oxidase
MEKQAIIIGAGITGLSAAWKLAEAGYQVKVMEKNDYTGGMSSTFTYKNHQLDYGPHKIFTVMDHIMQEILNLFNPNELLSIEKKSHIRLRGKYLSYPVSMKDVFTSIGIGTGLSCGTGYAGSKIKAILAPREDISYEDWVVNRFGKPIYELVLGPYARKIWGNPQELSKDLAETRIAMPNLMEMVKQMLWGKKKDSPIINAEHFYYPLRGFIEISRKMTERIRKNGGEIHLGKTLASLNTDMNYHISSVTFADNSTCSLHTNDVVVSTVPLAELIAALGTQVNNDVRKAVLELKTRSLILLYIVFNQDRITDDNWLFFPENIYRFNRVFEQKGFNLHMIPTHKTVLCLEITCNPDDSLWSASDEEVYLACEAGLRKAGLPDEEIEEYFTRRLPDAYPIYDLYYKENLNQVMNFLDTIPNLYSIGRQGCFSYAGMADCMDMGMTTAGFISNNRQREEWKQLRQGFYEYVVVD